MKRALALAAALALAGCASDGYYGGYYSSYGYDGYGSYDGYSPYYYYDTQPYGYTYDATPYYYGAPALGGAFYWSDRDRRHDHDRRDGWRRDRDRDRDWDRGDVQRAPAERLDPGNALRPQAPRPAAPAERLGPTSGMTHDESIAAGGR